MEPTDRLDVTLTAVEWNTIMQQLAEGPFRIVQSLIVEIQRQCAAQQQPPQPRLVEPAAE